MKSILITMMNVAEKIVITFFQVLMAITIAIIVGSIADVAYQSAMLPKICDHPPQHMVDVEPAFSALVQKTYPTPMPREALMRTLLEQGFHKSKRTDKEGNQTFVYAEFNFFPCAQSWMIVWTNGADGLAYNIKGRYHSACL